MIVADRVLLVGGPYDGCIATFGMGRYLCMHDPSGARPDSLYAYNLQFSRTNFAIGIFSAVYIGPGPARPPETGVV